MTLQFDSKLQNQTARLDEKIDKAAENFNILGTNLTEQLQKQEIHAAKSWVSRELNNFSSSVILRPSLVYSVNDNFTTNITDTRKILIENNMYENMNMTMNKLEL